MYYSHPCITRTEYLLNSFEIKKKRCSYVKHEEFIRALFNTKNLSVHYLLSYQILRVSNFTRIELKMAELGRFRVETGQIYDNAN